ncbi:MAG: transposase [Isosphaeraceae bacterium]
MAIARAYLVDPAVTRWYHCITRYVRRAYLLGEGANDRKVWIDQRLEELAAIFSIVAR